MKLKELLHGLDVLELHADEDLDITGGRIIAAGTPDEIRQDPASVTGRYL